MEHGESNVGGLIMCDGDFGGFSDPDYDDFEFREQHPYVYGDDGAGSSPTRSRRQSRYDSAPPVDNDFHQRYLKYKRDHPEKMRELRKSYKSPESASTADMIAGFLIIVFVITFCIIMCAS